MWRGLQLIRLVLLLKGGKRRGIHISVETGVCLSFQPCPIPSPPTGTSPEAIAEGLTKRTLAARGEILTTNLNASAANYTRDAMAKVGGALWVGLILAEVRDV